jgi:hypothetical protein
MPQPPDDPRPELILASLATAYAAISTANGFWTDVKKIERQRRFAEDDLKSGECPHIALVGGERSRERLGSGGGVGQVLYRVTFTALVFLAVHNRTGGLSVAMERFIGDVERKTAEQPHRGTLAGGGFIAEDTYVQRGETDEGMLTPFEFCRLEIVCTYQHIATNP